MASRCLEEERSRRHAHSSGINRAPTRAAATGSGELALAVLAAAGPPQLAILDLLEQAHKMRLGSTCTSLRLCSLAWFPEVTVRVLPAKTDVASLAAWMERHQACLHLRIATHGPSDHKALIAKWSSILTVLPSPLITSLAARSPFGWLATVSTLSALTRLEYKATYGEDSAWDGEEGDGLPFAINHLRPLTRLRQLCLVNMDLRNNAEELLALPCMETGLQVLRLHSRFLKQLPRALSSLTQLTALNVSVSCVDFAATTPLASLQRLQSLVLDSCSLEAVPEQLSALTALTSLGLCCNKVKNGWQRLLCLTQLQDLDLQWCSLTVVPEQLSALAALTHPDLSYNEELASGWQHLLRLTRLQGLALPSCQLGAAVPEQLSAMTALTHLQLPARRLDSGWQHLLHLIHLQDLELHWCELAAVLEQLSALTALTRLHLSCNLQLAGGWQHLLHLTHLQDLSLAECKLTAVPEPVSALTALTSLDLSYNNLESGWQHLLWLTHLCDLYLDNCELAAVPEQMAALTNLTFLDLSVNELAAGLQHLLSLPRLQTLYLSPKWLPGKQVLPALATLPYLHVVEYDMQALEEDWG